MYRDSRYLLDISYKSTKKKNITPVFRFEAQARMWRYGLRGLVDLGGLAGATVKSMGFFWENGRIISIISDLIIKYNKDMYIYICHTHIYI